MPLVPVPVAPGQLITFYFDFNYGDGAVSSSLPLPTTLAGISVRAYQVDAQFDLPMVAVFYDTVSSRGGSIMIAEGIMAVTVQIPYELVPPLVNPAPNSTIGIFQGSNQNATATIKVFVQPDAIHIIRNGDNLTNRNYGIHPFVGPFPPAITHADGSYVSPTRPAKPGETVSIWAVGLGLPSSGTVATGAANPSPPLTTTVTVDFEFRSNAGPSMPSATDSGGSHTPAIKVPAYFAPGFVGLYQINVTIPQPPVPLESCGGVFQSNLTVNIGGVASYDGVGICVMQQ